MKDSKPRRANLRRVAFIFFVWALSSRNNSISQHTVRAFLIPLCTTRSFATPRDAEKHLGFRHLEMKTSDCPIPEEKKEGACSNQG
jgi:hypothetical protein